MELGFWGLMGWRVLEEVRFSLRVTEEGFRWCEGWEMDGCSWVAMFGWLELGCGFWLSWNGCVRDSVGLGLIGGRSDGIGFEKNMRW